MTLWIPFFTRVYLLVLDQGRRRSDHPSSQGNHRKIAWQYFQHGETVVLVDRHRSVAPVLGENICKIVTRFHVMHDKGSSSNHTPNIMIRENVVSFV